MESNKKGHLDQEQKWLQSTKPTVQTSERDEDSFLQKKSMRMYQQFSTICDPTPTSKIYMDLMGKFPHTSSRGNKYLVVLHDHDSNAIVFKLIKTRQSKEILEALRKRENKIATYKKNLIYTY